jgi:hypothetical protein
MRHLYETNDPIPLIHLCEGSETVPGDPGTYLVWTKCGIDVPAGKSFRSMERANCSECLKQIKPGE